MVVCHCNAVNDERIRAEVLAGAADADDLASRCGAGATCGGCQRTIDDLLDRMRSALHAASAA